MPRTPNSSTRLEPADVAMTALVAPFVRSGKVIDRTHATPPDEYRIQRASVLVAADGVGEPRATLYTDCWKEARIRVAELRPAKLGILWTCLLEHQERGWVYVRPLAHVVEEARCWTAKRDPAAALYQFVDVEVVDLYRYNAFRCAEMVVAIGGTGEIPLVDDIDAETDTFYRNVSLLRLASAHRLAPPDIRLLADHAAGLDAWYAEFNGVFAPAAEAFYRVLGS